MRYLCELVVDGLLSCFHVDDNCRLIIGVKNSRQTSYCLDSGGILALDW